MTARTRRTHGGNVVEKAVGVYLDEYGQTGHETKCKIYSVRTLIIGVRVTVALFIFIIKLGYSLIFGKPLFDFTAILVETPTLLDWFSFALTILFIFALLSAISQVLTILYRRWYYENFCKVQSH